MRRVVIGTAGHIDHGKTTLVKSLTGVETDRLSEEKRRGITIELGFAPWKLSESLEASIVDVPGHEKLVRTMVAGAAGMDVAMVVVAADDGVMPQTREHLDILRLLDVQNIVVAVTKADLVDEELYLLVEDDVQSVLTEKGFSGVRTIKTSSETGLGLNELKAEVIQLCGAAKEKSQRPFLMPIDRAFLREGHGTVVTGTPLRGILKNGDRLAGFGAGGRFVEELKVRGLQNVGQSLDEVYANMRSAINISGKDAHSLKRGMNLFKTGEYDSTRHLVVSVQALDTVDELSQQTFALHLGTGSLEAELVLCSAKSLAAGDSGGALLRLSESIVAFAGQRFVLRKPGSTGQATVAGGWVIDPLPLRGKGALTRATELCAAQGDDEKNLLLLLGQSRASGVSSARLRQRMQVEDLSGFLSKQKEAGLISPWPDGQERWILSEVQKSILEKAITILQNYLQEEPLSQGLKEAEWVARLPTPEQELLQAVLKAEDVSGRAVRDGAFWRLKGEGSEISAQATAQLEKILKIYEQAQNTPPLESEIVAEAGISVKEFRTSVDYLVAKEKLIKVKSGLYYNVDCLSLLSERVLSYLRQKDEMAAADFKELAGGISRKWAIPLLEYFDAQGMTVRVGNARKLHPKMRN